MGEETKNMTCEVVQQQAEVAIPELRKINIGAGENPVSGYENWDRKTGQEAFPLDTPDGSCAEIRASHILEHFHRLQVKDVLLDWRRALAPGGLLKISVPDFGKLANAYVSGKAPELFTDFVMGSHSDADDVHHSLFDQTRLVNLLAECDFTHITRWDASQELDCSRYPISLNIMARKPATDGIKTAKDCIMVLAGARFGPAMHHKCTYEAILITGISYATEISCFWHESMCGLLERACTSQNNFKYVITGDYDSIYSPTDILEMYRIMEAFPDLDALAPIQMKRGLQNIPLLSIRNAAGQAIPNDVLQRNRNNIVAQVDTAHFGLTFIRLDTLRKFPKPWMDPKPDSTGGYSGDDKVCADIDFWLKWKKCGFSLAVAPHVVIGHMEEVLKWPGPDGNVFYQAFQDYLNNGTPAHLQR